ncbi:S41 family peptidase [Chishuiella sp.]|uniref:S41 family peptidase n=1 Tax=Chishuiella sp. TaxID=1969467 RepID=UPI0028A5FC89|nr:S41 family peptidase [Chishuiella sp.]
MKKNNFLLLFFIGLCSYSFGQECTCESNFLWTKKTFEENDAGFNYILQKKGKEAYDLHNKIFLEKVKQLPNNYQCANTIDTWVRFFRDGHIGINYIKPKPEENSKQLEILKYNEKDFKKYLDKLKINNNIEGIWDNNGEKIGIVKIKNQYKGFILNTNSKNWAIGEVKTIFNENDGLFYSSNKIENKISTIKKIGNSYLKLGDILLKKDYPKVNQDQSIEKGYQQLTSTKPFFEKLDSNTAYLRIPDFEITEKKLIDSVIAKNKEIILSTKNLIIDVRNNPGGSDNAFEQLIPFLYTQPIRTVSALFYSTELNNQRMYELSNNPDFDEESRKKFKGYFEKLDASKGKYVDLFNKEVNITKLDCVYEYPQNIGIVINHKNGSTTEQFLLNAKQSKKVKLYGKTTKGMLDISNVNIVESPCKDFELYYGLSKSFRIPDFAVDDIGLQPDIFIDGTIEDYNWIHFVEEHLNQ